MTSTTTYRLACGHHAAVPGPMGATSGRAWCDSCDESRAVACELCNGPDPLYDAHGWYCQGCRDRDGGEG